MTQRVVTLATSVTSVATALIVAAAVPGCTDDGGSGGVAAGSTAAPIGTTAAAVVVQFGPDVAPRVRQRVEDLLHQAAAGAVEVRAATDAPAGLAPGTLLVGIGDTRITRDLIPQADVDAAGSEGFVLRSGDLHGARAIACDGNAPDPDLHHLGIDQGTSYGAYALLEELGFAFLHPLEPLIPPHVAAPPATLDRTEAPHWPQRGWHIHTMHPLELTDLLNGWGPGGPSDAAGWQSQLPLWELFCEWAVANRQNEVEWLLLSAKSWEAFADGPVRQQRLAELVQRAHAWGLAVGADVPLALQQQHSWTILREIGDPAREQAQIQDRIDYLAAAGFDFLATELGFSEFTKPDDRKMLAWLDAFTAAAAGHGMPAFSKIHVSHGQTADNFVDPDTGLPLNFNFLPHYADPRLGVMPHTVQHYALDDPAPTYGQTDFDFMREFLQEEAGARPVLWHPETAYWVSFDVDVPLFLPVYADRRLHDLRLIAQDELAGRTGRGPHAGARIQGQMVFSSGWEWGYWLNDVVAARAAWDPQLGAADHEEALRRTLAPVVRPFGAAAPQVLDQLVALIQDQRDLLIEGEVNGQAPSTVVMRNGQAYLQGWETWDDVAELVALIPGLPRATTQPSKLGLVDMRRPWKPGLPDYVTEVDPLLAAMEDRFTRAADAFAALTGQVAPEARPLMDEIVDAARMTALRARQVHGLYDYVGGANPDPAWRRARLDTARDALDQAQLVVSRREAAYRVDPDLIAGWRDGPTAYEYGYLWTVRSLHFWWRDEGKAVDAPISPAYLNHIDPLDVAFGEGFWLPLAEMARRVGGQLGAGPVTDLLDAPDQEPVHPQGGLRQRP